MKLKFILLAAFAATINLANSADPQVSPDPALLERGEYLVRHVAMCGDCHSPRGKDGVLVPGKEFTGASLGFAPLAPMPWAAYAPGIAGLPTGWSSENMAQFLMSGNRPFDMPPVNPPMPAYRLTQADAEAITAYLKSLAVQK